MKKLTILLLTLLANNTFGMGKDPVEKAAEKFTERGDYSKNIVELTPHASKNFRTVATVISYFKFKDPTPIAKALNPDIRGNYDIRSLETALCRLAQESQPFSQKHRGKLGFALGATAISLIWTGYAYYNQNNSAPKLKK